MNEANRSTNESFRVVALVTASASVAPDALVYGSDQDGNLYLAEVFNGRVDKFRRKYASVTGAK